MVSVFLSSIIQRRIFTSAQKIDNSLNNSFGLKDIERKEE